MVALFSGILVNSGILVVAAGIVLTSKYAWAKRTGGGDAKEVLGGYSLPLPLHHGFLAVLFP